MLGWGATDLGLDLIEMGDACQPLPNVVRPRDRVSTGRLRNNGLYGQTPSLKGCVLPDLSPLAPMPFAVQEKKHYLALETQPIQEP